MTDTTRYKRTRQGVVGIYFLLLLAWSSFFPVHAFAASRPGKATKPTTSSRTITLRTNNDVLLNPGKGWVVYGTPSEQTAQTIAYATVGYTRYDWAQIEPVEGQYNWAQIDKDMAAWHAYGKKFAFGIMSANTSNPLLTYVTPAWVFKDGAAYIKIPTYSDIPKRKTIQYIPVWNNPVFISKLKAFITALAHRYDGNPDIAFIDIRSYGNWGVQNVDGLPHSTLLTKAELQAHLQLYLNVFKHTQLLVPWGTPLYNSVYTWVISKHVGLRRDGIMGDSNGSEIAPNYGKTLGAFEFYDSYQALIQAGLWSNAKLIASVNTGKPSYISMGLWYNDSQAILAQQPQLIQSLANKMGYYFVLSKATIPITITNRKANTFSFSWENKGVAYLYGPVSVAVALLNASNAVVQKQWLSNINPRTWTPGKTTVTTAAATFSNIPKGKYKLAIGLFLHTKDSSPTYKIGNQGRTSNNWYVLSSNDTVS